jgi:hypothetical protein
MSNNTYVWVVESLGDDTPTLLSVHTTKEKAMAAGMTTSRVIVPVQQTTTGCICAWTTQG